MTQLPTSTLIQDINTEPLLLDDSEDEEYLLSELQRRVILKNIRNHVQIKKAGGLISEFDIGDIVLLTIPSKNRLPREATRLPCRILKKARRAYTLLSQFGQLKGAHQGSSLSIVISSEQYDIPTTNKKGQKYITLPSAVT